MTPARRRRIRLRALLKRQGGLCYWCAEPIKITGERCAHQATLDHLEPRDCPDRERAERQAAACFRCNSSRHHDIWEPHPNVVMILEAAAKREKAELRAKRRERAEAGGEDAAEGAP
jgi:hypothetical protein